MAAFLNRARASVLRAHISQRGPTAHTRQQGGLQHHWQDLRDASRHEGCASPSRRRRPGRAASFPVRPSSFPRSLSAHFCPHRLLGPEIRTGMLKDSKAVDLVQGNFVTLTTVRLDLLPELALHTPPPVVPACPTQPPQPFTRPIAQPCAHQPPPPSAYLNPSETGLHAPRRRHLRRAQLPAPCARHGPRQHNPHV